MPTLADSFLDRLAARLKQIMEPPQQKQETSEPIEETLTLEQAENYIQDKFLQGNEAYVGACQDILQQAMAGEEGMHLKAIELICSTLTANRKKVAGMDLQEAARLIYARIWGLDVVEDLYRDPEVNEIQVNDENHVFVNRLGRNEKAPVVFDSPDRVEMVIKRMLLHDVGVSLDRSTPRVESIRRDGSRLTATCYPVSRTWSFVLRKHDTFEMTVENLKKHGTMDAKVWEALRLLVKGRVNIIFSGNVGSGKTTLMRRLVGELDPSLRLVVIGKDLELLLREHYPDRNVVEFEEHPEVGADMPRLFETTLRESPDVILVEEFRGSGEALEAIRACTRGHPGSMATAHFNSPMEAVEGTALMILEEGLNIPLELAELRVARAFDVVVQLMSDTVRGIKKLVGITEIVVRDGRVYCNDLVRWEPAGEDFFGDGEWRFISSPTPALRSKMFRFGVTDREIEKAGWHETVMKDFLCIIDQL